MIDRYREPKFPIKRRIFRGRPLRSRMEAPPPVQTDDVWEWNQADFLPDGLNDPVPVKRNGFLHQLPAKRHLILPCVFALGALAMNIVMWTWPQDKQWWVSQESVFRLHQNWRVVAALAAHADLVHWLHNAPLFIFFAWWLGAYFGMLAFPFMTLIIGVLSNLLTIYNYAPEIEVYGASGMIYGMVALWLVLYISFERGKSLPVKLMRATGFALLMLFPQSYEPRVSYLAHGAGFLVGFGCGIALIPWYRWRLPKEEPLKLEMKEQDDVRTVRTDDDQG